METLINASEKNEIDMFYETLLSLNPTELDKINMISYAQGMLSMKRYVNELSQSK